MRTSLREGSAYMQFLIGDIELKLHTVSDAQLRARLPQRCHARLVRRLQRYKQEDVSK